MKQPLKNSLISFSILLAASACQDMNIGATGAGALGGAAAGAGLGAIIGNQTGNAGAGVAIGSAVGARGGALVGRQIENQDKALDARQRQIDEQDRTIQENRRMIEELRRSGVDARGSERGVIVNLPDVLFQFGRSELTSAARNTAVDIARTLQRTPTRHISVEGHTDSIGSIEYNQRLSDSRAQNVAQELERNGVPARRISTRALGESEPIASNRTEQGRRLNRRVEVIIENPRS
jgi:outer membrane protein OmpA-like peptidoglycan-associated protein